ncbi:MAG: exopolysaccharide biosynthesis polyprenyl glycosylphosphotransferase [Candidatus Zambryskibacteria bacterium]|nr:exopolysaccharide biosynthesis polyprenyl glycosylphosphotransferase [Candidatus Zambryskibacteria bacterium]
MSSLNRKEPLVLLLGDILFFLAALWLTLLLRNIEPPTKELFLTHLLPFSMLFAAWVIVFYIAGLYEKHTVILKSRLPNTLAAAQLTNSALAVIFFYFVPFFLITPKTILFIYLFVSFTLILFWRTHGYFAIGHRRASNAILIGSGEEMKELLNEVNNNPIYNLKFVSSVDLNRTDENGFWNEIVSRVYSEDVSVIAIDLAHENAEPVLPHLYNLIFSKVDFIDMHKVYEDIFNRVPLSLLRYNWFLENVSATPRIAYDALKRIMDVSVSLILFLISLTIYPFIYLAVKLDDSGELFFTQERVGEDNKVIKILKFRSMSDEENVTRIGKFLRKSRIDELPQLWSVLKGDLSLIGPRPELPQFVKQYTEQIPYYNIRHIIKPGLSGWAQIYHDTHPHHLPDTLETKHKLSYDLYYIKNRSLLLDLKIALRTLRTLVSLVGR